jgi:hypothetical protein
MTVSTVLLSVALFMIFALLCVSVYFNYKFGLTIINVQEEVEKSLDILDERYQKLTEISETPVFFDSMEIRQVIGEIKKTRDCVLLVANKLTSFDDDSTDEKEYEKEESG